MSRSVNLPVIDSETITLGERVGRDKHRCAVWRLHCECGHHFDVSSPRIKQGWYRCDACDTKSGAYQTQVMLGAMPGTYHDLIEKTGLSRDQVKHRLVVLRDQENRKCHIGRWAVCKTNGNPVPVFCPGDLPDVHKPPAQSTAKHSRKYRRNIAKAIQRARDGKPYAQQYAHHVGIALAKDNAARTRINPQLWFSALGL